jgi:hypothetical protein
VFTYPPNDIARCSSRCRPLRLSFVKAPRACREYTHVTSGPGRCRSSRARPLGSDTTYRAGVAVSEGPANATDWIGLYAAGAADTSYLVWYYLNGATSAPPTGIASAALNVLVPVMPGSYEVRLFAANGYDRLATESAGPWHFSDSSPGTQDFSAASSYSWGEDGGAGSMLPLVQPSSRRIRRWVSARSSAP